MAQASEQLRPRTGGGASAPPLAIGLRRSRVGRAAAAILPQLGWTILSIGLFAGIWELLWLIGWADPKLLPPPPVEEAAPCLSTPPPTLRKLVRSARSFPTKMLAAASSMASGPAGSETLALAVSFVSWE